MWELEGAGGEHSGSSTCVALYFTCMWKQVSSLGISFLKCPPPPLCCAVSLSNTVQTRPVHCHLQAVALNSGSLVSVEVGEQGRGHDDHHHSNSGYQKLSSLMHVN